MATVPYTAFYCTFHGLSGVITKPADAVLFLEPESGAVVTITPAIRPPGRIGCGRRGDGTVCARYDEWPGRGSV